MNDDAVALPKERLSEFARAPTIAAGQFDATIRADSAFAEGATLAQIDLPAPPTLPRISVQDMQKNGPSTSEDLALLLPIGEGGMGRIFLARQRWLDRDVAVKMLKEDATPHFSAALFREARVTGSLEHPGVIPVHALGADAMGRPLLVMKRVEGTDLRTLLSDPAHEGWGDRRKTDVLEAKLEIVTQVCRTLEFAHSKGVLHRDVKPENVMVGAFGAVYLLDWGIAIPLDEAKKTPPPLAGTPTCMAPEMFLGEVLDERTDVYLLGAMLHEVLTGKSRHEGSDIETIVRSALSVDPVKYDATVPAELAELCNRATARERSARPAKIADLREAVQEFQRGRGVRTLLDAAHESLTELHVLLESGGASEKLGTAVPADLSGAYRLANEARFGFMLSLKEHAQNASAKKGLREAILAMIELEMRQEHAATADALLREVEAPPAALLERLEVVRARGEEKEKAAERLAVIDRDLDPRTGRKTRAIAAAIYSTGWLVVLVLNAIGVKLSSYGSVALEGGFFIFVIALAFVNRARFRVNAYSRRLSHTVIVASGFMFGSRCVSIAIGQYDDAVALDLWVGAAALAVAAITIERGIAVATAPLLCAAFYAQMRPHSALYAQALGMLACAVCFAIAVSRHHRAAARKDLTAH